MIEQILTRKNLLQAMRQVQKNHGSAGVDHMPVTKLSELLSIDKDELTEEVRSGKYLPQPILGVEIGFAELVNSVPKGNKGVRLLRIPKLLSYYMSSQFVLGMFLDIPLNGEKRYHPKSSFFSFFGNLPPNNSGELTKKMEI